MQLDNLLGHRQAQPCPHPGWLGGEERIVNPGQMLLRDARACVIHLRNHRPVPHPKRRHPAQAFKVAGLGQLFGVGPHRQSAFRGHGLDGVDEDIDEHLLELGLVHRHRRELWPELFHQMDALQRQFVPHQLQSLLDHVVEIVRLDRQLPGRRKIEQPARDRIRPSNGFLHLFQHQAQVFVSGRKFFREVIHPHHENGEGVFHFVRHSGGEGADGFHLLRLDQLKLGRLQFFVRFAQRRLALGQILIRRLQLLLESLPLGDVPKDALDPDHLSFGIVDGRLDHVHVRLRPVSRHVLLHRFKRLSGADDVPVIALVLLCQLRGEEIEIRFADDLLKCPAKDRAKALVGEGEPLLQILAKNILRQVLHQRMIKCFRGDQLLFGALPFGHVGNQPFVSHQPPRPIPRGHHRVSHPTDLSALVQEAVLQWWRRFPPQHLLDLLLDRSPVFLVDHAVPKARVRLVILWPVARDGQRPRAVNGFDRLAVL